MTLAHFGCLTCAEFTVPNQLAFNPSIHLNLNDIVFHSLSTGVKFFTVKRSKTDIKNVGSAIYIIVHKKVREVLYFIFQMAVL